MLIRTTIRSGLESNLGIVCLAPADLAGLNTITLDGAPLTSQGALNRATNMNNLTGTMFDQMELIKGQTPDKGADSLGGTINLKSRSPLSLREKRRVSYSASARWARRDSHQSHHRRGLDLGPHGLGSASAFHPNRGT